MWDRGDPASPHNSLDLVYIGVFFFFHFAAAPPGPRSLRVEFDSEQRPKGRHLSYVDIPTCWNILESSTRLGLVFTLHRAGLLSARWVHFGAPISSHPPLNLTNPWKHSGDCLLPIENQHEKAQSIFTDTEIMAMPTDGFLSPNIVQCTPRRHFRTWYFTLYPFPAHQNSGRL